MANVRINVFENISHLANVNLGTLNAAGSIHIHAVNIPGSISFNNAIVALRVSLTGTQTGTLSVSFGLYSLNLSTLSLANSASQQIMLTTSLNSAVFSSLVTSATQDITPGTWYFAWMSSSVGAGTFRFYVGSASAVSFSSAYTGPFIRGAFSTSTTALPASIATTDCTKEGAITSPNLINQPYVLIGA